MQASQQHAVDIEQEARLLDDPALATARVVPSWFPASAQIGASDASYRPLQAEHSMEAATLRSFMQSRDPAQGQPLLRNFGTLPPRRPRSMAAPKSRPRNAAVYVSIGFMAALLGVGSGYVASRYDELREFLGQGTASLLPAVAPKTATAVPQDSKISATRPTRKPVATATLNVFDVSGDLDSVIPLKLHAESPVKGEDLTVRISGLPDTAYLTAGEKSKDKNWSIAARDVDDLGLVVPEIGSPQFNLAISAIITKTSELAAPIKEITVTIAEPEVKATAVSTEPEPVIAEQEITEPEIVEPEMPTPPAPEPPTAKVDVSPETRKLITNGDILMKSGDLAKARQFYELAFAQGSAEAAIGVGKTFDPNVYAELNVQGMAPDPVRAMEWYMRASAAGAKKAAAAIETLRQTPP